MPARLERSLQPWLPMAHVASERHGPDAFLGLAICGRETEGGTSSLLDVRGPAGTGDHVPRHSSLYAARHDLRPYLRLWTPEPTPETPKPVELCMPGDGRGWARGLMGLDFAAQLEFCLRTLVDDRPVWADPALNIDEGFRILRTCLDAFGGDEFLAAAAYNAGIGRVRRKLLELSDPATESKRYEAADSLTTHHNYAADVLGRRKAIRYALSAPYPQEDEVTK